MLFFNWSQAPQLVVCKTWCYLFCFVDQDRIVKKHVTLVDLKFETLTFKIGDLLEPDLAIKHKSDNFLLFWHLTQCVLDKVLFC